MEVMATQTQETFDNTAKAVKESWNRPEFEIIGVEKTEHQGNPGDDGFGTSTLS